MNKPPPKTFSRLLLWEIENNLNIPSLSVIVASAIIAVLVQSTTISGFTHDYGDLAMGVRTIFLMMSLVACLLFSRSFAGSFGRGDLKRILSYPVKRWQVFLSKTLVLNLMIFSIYASAYAMNLYVNALSLLEPMFYVSLFTIFLQLLLVCAVTVGVSMLTKNEVMSIVISFMIIFGLDNIFEFNSIFSSMGRFWNIFDYFKQVFHPSSYGVSSAAVTVTFEQFMGSVLFPLLTAFVVLGVVFVYFTRKMEVD